MVRIVRSTAFWLSFAVVCTAVESSVVGAPLRGEIRRQVINPFGLASDLGWGLAQCFVLAFRLLAFVLCCA